MNQTETSWQYLLPSTHLFTRNRNNHLISFQVDKIYLLTQNSRTGFGKHCFSFFLPHHLVVYMTGIIVQIQKDNFISRTISVLYLNMFIIKNSSTT